MSKLRILLAEDHSVMRDGLRMVIERDVPAMARLL
jgi:DNA-binding NarL/FixJ family response regulator